MAVGFSGGKDSTIVLNLAIRVAEEKGKLPVEAVFWDEEAIHPETIEYMYRVSEDPRVMLRWMCLPIQHRNVCSKKDPYWYCWAPEDKDRWIRPLPTPRGGVVTELAGFTRRSLADCNGLLFPKNGEQIGWMTGIRADESLRRFRFVTHRTVDNYISCDHEAKHVWMVKPIYDWTTSDVWTAPRHFEWDYNHAYDVMWKAGIPRSEQRVCAPYGEQPLENLWMYRICWPELWEKMIGRVPGAATAARYATTPLWAYGDVLKPGHETWKEAIRRELLHWEPVTRQKIAERITTLIRHHEGMTTCPIPETEMVYDAFDSSSGVTWKMLLYIAVRGDTKARKTAVFRSADKKG